MWKYTSATEDIKRKSLITGLQAVTLQGFAANICCSLWAVGNRVPIVLFQQWSDGTSGKVLILYKEAEEGHFQTQLPGRLNNVREQDWLH